MRGRSSFVATAGQCEWEAGASRYIGGLDWMNRIGAKKVSHYVGMRALSLQIANLKMMYQPNSWTYAMCPGWTHEVEF